SLMRVLLTVGISYADSPERAITIIEEILGEHHGVVGTPAPMVTVDEFGDSSVNLRVCYYIDLRGEHSGFVTRSEVLTTIRNRFETEGLTIPFPQRDIRVIDTSPGSPLDSHPEPQQPKRPAPAPEHRDAAVEMADGDDQT
ncbi:MAG: hypothetical protein AAFW98_20040, partial [Pseudomonadota bacterium]